MSLAKQPGPWGAQEVNHDANGQKVQTRWYLPGQQYALTETRDAGGYVLAKSYSDGDAVGGISNPWSYDRAGRLTLDIQARPWNYV